MRSTAVLPLVATVISFEFTLALVRRYRASRRPHLRSWAVSMAFYTVGCAALWYGSAFGWSEPTFRVYYVGGALLATPWLAMGELELLMRPVPARVVAVFLVLLSLNAAFVVATVPLVDGATVSGFALPHGKDLLPVAPRVLIVVSNSVSTAVVVGGTLWSARRAGPRFRGLLLVALGVAFAAGSGGFTFLGEESAVALGLALGAAFMYAGFVLASRRPPARATSAGHSGQPTVAVR